MRIPPKLSATLALVAATVSAQHPGSYVPSVYAGGGANSGSVVSPTDALLSPPLTLAYDFAGNLLTVEASDITPRVRRLGSDGQLRTISTGTFIPLPQSRLGIGINPQPWSITTRPDGTAVLARDQRKDPAASISSYQVVQLGASGSLTALAGTGTRGFSDGPASSAQFAEISALAADSAGNIYVADDGNFRIRKLSAAGTVTTIAGTGVQGSQGDGSSAVSAQVGPVGGLALLNGAVYFTQPATHTIRRIRTDGIVETVAGNGKAGSPQDGLDARAAALISPTLIVATPDGRIVFLDGPAQNWSSDPTWRTVDASGKIWTVYDPRWGRDLDTPVIDCVPKTGQIQSALGIGAYAGLAIDSAGNLLTAAWGIGSGWKSVVYRLAPTPILLNAGGIVSAASYNYMMSPGLLFVAYGNGLGPDQLSSAAFDANGLLPTQFAGTQVFFDGLPAPLVYARNDVVAGFVPYGTANVAASGPPCSVVQVKRGGKSSALVAKLVSGYTPGIFTLDGSGVGQAVAFNEDNTVNGPANPAARGHIVVFFGTGVGVTTPASVDGNQAVPPNLPKPAGSVAVQIGGQQAQILYAGASPYSPAGVIQVNAVVPDSASTGSDVKLELLINGESSDNLFVSSHVVIAVK